MQIPVWERGFRCHGYWIGVKRVGWVGLPPRLPVLDSYAKIEGYTWGVEHKGRYIEGAGRTLRGCKRKVERVYREVYGGE